MECKICGHRTYTLNSMRIHYLKKHPAAMKRKKKSQSRETIEAEHWRKQRKPIGERFCAHCGAKLDNPCKR